MLKTVLLCLTTSIALGDLNYIEFNLYTQVVRKNSSEEVKSPLILICTSLGLFVNSCCKLDLLCRTMYETNFK